MLREKTNQKTDQEQFIRSTASTARPLIIIIGETGRNLTTRQTEHKRATKKGDLNNNIAEHHLKTMGIHPRQNSNLLLLKPNL